MTSDLKTSKRSSARVAIILVTAVIASLIAWSYLSEIEQLARAQGQIVASMRTQFIQASDDGVIESLSVIEGQQVKRDEILVQFDSSQADTAMRDSRSKVAALKAALARLHAEVSDTPLKFPSDVKAYPDFVNNQTNLFTRRQSAIKQELVSLQKLRSSAESELAMNEPLLKMGDVSKVEILRLKKTIDELDGAISNRSNKYFQDAQAEITKIEEDLSSQEQILDGRSQALARTVLVAPTDGIIRNIRLTTRGARVRPGDVVMDILPTNGELIFEAKVKPLDIAFIHVGSPAAIKLDSYDYAIYGVLHGEVSYISPDALTEDSRTGEQVYYRVRVRINATDIKKTKDAKSIEPQPGMTGQVEMHTGRQNVFTYLMKPLMKTMSTSMSER